MIHGLTLEEVVEEIGEPDEFPHLDPWQEEIYQLYELFHSVRKGGFGPEPFEIGELERVLRARGYREVEVMVGLLVSMDLTYRIWWDEEKKKQDG